MIVKIISNSIEDTAIIAGEIAKLYDQKGGVLALFGDLGSGKTTFTALLAQKLGIKDRVTSPTFTIMREYQIPNSKRKLIHIDLYRIEDPTSLQSLGLEEIFRNPHNLVIIEWPNRLDKLPISTKTIYFKFLGENTREIKT